MNDVNEINNREPLPAESAALAATDNDKKYDDAVFIALELGEHILKCGGEIYRAEDTVKRICKAYGAVTVDVTAILSVIVLTVDFGDKSITSSRRLSEFGSNNLGRLSRLNDLSRRVCAEKPTKEEFLKRMGNINGSTRISLRRCVLGSMFSAMGFAIFFSNFGQSITMDTVWACLIDGLLAALVALPLSLITRYLSHTKLNAVIAKFLVCLLGGTVALFLGRVVPQCHVDMIMIGNIMNVIPGVSMANAFRDVFSGDVMSGALRLCAVVVDAIAIAFGYAVAILLFGGVI